MNCKSCGHPYDVLEVSKLCHRCADKRITDVEKREQAARKVAEASRHYINCDDGPSSPEFWEQYCAALKAYDKMISELE